LVLAAVLVAVLVGTLGGPVAVAADAEADGDSFAAEIPTAPVELDGRPLFRVRGTSTLPAPERAGLIAGRLTVAARDPAVTPDAIVIVETPPGREIRAGDQRLLLVTPGDAALESVDVETTAELYRAAIAGAITRYRAERQPRALLRGVIVSLGATGLLALAIGAAWWLVRRLDARVDQAFEKRQQALASRLGPELIPPASVRATLRSLLRKVGWVAVASFTFLWLGVVLAQFPWTRVFSDGLGGLVLQPLATIGLGIVEYLPNLLFLVVLTFVVRFALRLLRLYFEAVDRGSITLAHFEREWAMPTYKIARTLLVLVTLVMAYPYLPGSGSAAFQGISVFAGLLVSLGAASSVSNVIAGYLVTYGRIIRLNDWIRVGDTFGVVTRVNLLSTRLRTPRNEEVTIPNSVILSASVTNYSTLAGQRGLILQAEVGIGYETPWRQVHAMLLEAARRASWAMVDPAPFILQRSLGDFAVVYQLNVYRPHPEGLLLAQTELNQHILDVFNEYDVQIMTPAYVADTPQPKVVPKSDWYLPPAAPPAAADRPPPAGA
jgi:small-conductance mechanosensitive channel